MRRLLRSGTVLLVLGAALAGACGGSPPSAGPMPRPASAFLNSVGVNTHSVYYDTAYGDWNRVVAELGRLGVRHVRDGIFGNPAPQWTAWNARYDGLIEEAAARGIRFDFVAGKPQNPTGTIAQLVGVAATRLRNATESLEGPNEYDTGSPAGWPAALRDYQHGLFAAVQATPALDGVPVVGPSFGADDEGDVGSLAGALDVGNVHPYTGGLSPTPEHVADELSQSAFVTGAEPVWATEAGFHDAMNATTGQAPVPEDVAAVYTLRTLLEHYDDGIARTYLYELIDEKPDPALRDPEQHFGLLRNDFSEKPAFVALRNLLALMGPSRPPDELTPLDLHLQGDPVRTLLLERADGVHVLILWSEDSLWNISSRTRISPPERSARLVLPAGMRATAYLPAEGMHGKLLTREHGAVQLRVGPDPLVLLVSTG